MSFDANNSQFMLAPGTSAAKVDLSDRLFDFFKTNITLTNEQFRTMKSQGLELIEISHNTVKVFDPKDGFDLPTKMDEEFEKGEIDDFEWNGLYTDFYLSHSTVNYVAKYGPSAAVAAGLISGAVSSIYGIAGLVANDWIDRYPNGVVISVAHVTPGIHVPVYVRG